MLTKFMRRFMNPAKRGLAPKKNKLRKKRLQQSKSSLLYNGSTMNEMA